MVRIVAYESRPSDKRNIEETGFFISLSLSCFKASSIPKEILVPPLLFKDDIFFLKLGMLSLDTVANGVILNYLELYDKKNYL